MKRIIMATLLAALLSGCTDDSPPHWENVCVVSHQESSMVLVPGEMGAAMGGIPLGGGLHMVEQSNTVCDRREAVCMVGKDYKGGATCPNH